MIRCFFHLRTGDGLERDETGLELDDMEEAFFAAHHGARDMLNELMAANADPTDYAYVVCDAGGAVLLTLPFAEVLRSRHEPARLRGARRSDGPGRAAARLHAVAEALGAEVRAAQESVRRSRELLESTRLS